MKDIAPLHANSLLHQRKSYSASASDVNNSLSTAAIHHLKNLPPKASSVSKWPMASTRWLRSKVCILTIKVSALCSHSSGYEEGKPYKLEPAKARPYYIDQYATLVAGEWTRTFPLTHCSNSRFANQEVEEWKRASQDAGKRLPTSTWAQKKCEDLHSLINFHFESGDITKKLAKQNKYQHLLIAELQAKQAPKTDVRAEQQRRMAEASRKKKIEAEEAMRAANVAKKARQRAALKELEAMKVAERKKAEAAQSLQVPRSELDDLFEGGSDLSRTATPQPGDRKADAGKEKKAVRETIKGIPTFTRKKMDDEIIGAIDLGIDIEI